MLPTAVAPLISSPRTNVPIRNSGEETVLGGGDAGVGPRQATVRGCKQRGWLGCIYAGGKMVGNHSFSCGSIHSTVISVLVDSESRDGRSHFPSPHTTGSFRNGRKDRSYFRFCHGAWHYNGDFDKIAEKLKSGPGGPGRFSVVAMPNSDPFFAISASGFPLLLLISLLLLLLRRGCVNC